MKFHDRARTRRPDLSSIVPLAVLFITSLDGPTVHEALRSSLGIFFSPVAGPILWIQVILLNFALFGYFSPIFRAHILCLHACEPTAAVVDLAFKRLNRIRFATIAISVVFFVAGRFALFLFGVGGPGGRVPLGSDAYAELPLHLWEAAADGFFAGVILALQFDFRFYERSGDSLQDRRAGEDEVFLAVLESHSYPRRDRPIHGPAGLLLRGELLLPRGQTPAGSLPPGSGMLSGPLWAPSRGWTCSCTPGVSPG